MKYNTLQLLEILKDTVKNNSRHKYYNRTVELAKLYRQWNTGEGQDELIVSLKSRETKEQKEQRIKIYNSRTKFVSEQIQAAFDEVERADNVIDNIYYKNTENEKDNQNKLGEIHERLDKFSDRQDLKEYLHEKIKYFNFYDPNAFLVVDFMKYNETEKPWTYPVEIYSHQAINYEYDRKRLQYLIALQETVKKVKNDDGKIETKPADLFYLWAADYAIKLQELGEPGKYILPDFNEGAPDSIIVIERKCEGEKEHKAYEFALWEFETRSKVNPAIQVGYIGDPKTNLNTYVGILDKASEIFKDLINTKSEYDLHKALHGFLKQFAYANTCDYSRYIEGKRFQCDGGKIRGSNEECPKCHGHGLILHTTSQDIILIKKPDGKDEHIPLDEMIHYVEIPQHIIEAQKKELEELEQRVPRAVFNANPFDRSEIAITATEKRLLKESVYNAFMKYGAVYSQVYKHCVKLTAIHLLNDEGLVVDHQFPKDYHLDTIDELLSMRKAAVEAHAPYTIIEVIDFNILTKQSQDDPTHIEIIRAKEQWRPFREKSKEERILIVSSLPETNFQRLLYIHFEEVFDLILYGEKFIKAPFFKLKYDKQKEVIREALETVLGKTIEELEAESLIPDTRSLFQTQQIEQPTN